MCFRNFGILSGPRDAKPRPGLKARRVATLSHADHKPPQHLGIAPSTHPDKRSPSKPNQTYPRVGGATELFEGPCVSFSNQCVSERAPQGPHYHKYDRDRSKNKLKTLWTPTVRNAARAMEAHVRDKWPRYTEEPVTDLPGPPPRPQTQC